MRRITWRACVGHCAHILLISSFVAGTAPATPVIPWSYSDLVEQSDLIVIGQFVGKSDVNESNIGEVELKVTESSSVRFVFSKFSVSGVLKPSDSIERDPDSVLLLHYELAAKEYIGGNLPPLLTFQKQLSASAAEGASSAGPVEYLLFLRRSGPGYWEPVAGQTYLAHSVRVLLRPDKADHLLFPTRE